MKGLARLNFRLPHRADVSSEEAHSARIYREAASHWRPQSWVLFVPVLLSSGALAAEQPAGHVSFYHDVRPILQANCQGCHQPAKAKGGFVMTDFKKLLAGGDNEGAAIVPGQAAKSSLLKMVRPHDGEVRMPKGKTPLVEAEVGLIAAWIEQGAQD